MDLIPLGDGSERLGVGHPTLLILGRPSCDDCVAWYAELHTWTPSSALTVRTLDLTTELGTSFKQANPWTEHIDFIPFNVLYVDGEPVDQWTGGGLERLVKRLEAMED